jgi:hypothetical protein
MTSTGAMNRKIARGSVGSHENPTDSELAVSALASVQRGWRRIIPGKKLNRTDSISVHFPARRNEWVGVS